MSYLCGWMIVDFVSSVPMDIIEIAILGSEIAFENDLLKLTRLPRMYRLLRIFKLFKFFRILKGV
jgi:hypothetical protein